MKKIKQFIIALVTLGAIHQANATLIVNFEEVGADVVITFSGSINTTDLASGGGGSGGDWINIRPTSSYIASSGAVPYVGWSGVTFNGILGNGSDLFERTPAVGDRVGIDEMNTQLITYQGYQSGTAINSTMTFSNTNMETLDINPDFTVTWGTGANADSAIVTGVVPEPVTAGLLGISALVLYGIRRIKNFNRA